MKTGKVVLDVSGLGRKNALPLVQRKIKTINFHLKQMSESLESASLREYPDTLRAIGAKSERYKNAQKKLKSFLRANISEKSQQIIKGLGERLEILQQEWVLASGKEQKNALFLNLSRIRKAKAKLESFLWQLK